MRLRFLFELWYTNYIHNIFRWIFQHPFYGFVGFSVTVPIGFWYATTVSLNTTIILFYASILFFKELFKTNLPIPTIKTREFTSRRAKDDNSVSEEGGFSIRYNFDYWNRGSGPMGHIQIFSQIFDSEGNRLPNPHKDVSELNRPVIEREQEIKPRSPMPGVNHFGIPVAVVEEDSVGDVYYVKLVSPVFGHPLMAARKIERVEITEDLLEKGKSS